MIELQKHECSFSYFQNVIEGVRVFLTVLSELKKFNQWIDQNNGVDQSIHISQPIKM